MVFSSESNTAKDFVTVTECRAGFYLLGVLDVKGSTKFESLLVSR